MFKPRGLLHDRSSAHLTKVWHSAGGTAPTSEGLIIWSILHSSCICSLNYFLFQPVVHKWSIKGYGMSCPVCGKVHIKDSLLLIGFPLKKYVIMTVCLTSSSQWYENQCALEVSWNKTNIALLIQLSPLVTFLTHYIFVNSFRWVPWPLTSVCGHLNYHSRWTVRKLKLF